MGTFLFLLQQLQNKFKNQQQEFFVRYITEENEYYVTDQQIAKFHVYNDENLDDYYKDVQNNIYFKRNKQPEQFSFLGCTITIFPQQKQEKIQGIDLLSMIKNTDYQKQKVINDVIQSKNNIYIFQRVISSNATKNGEEVQYNIILESDEKFSNKDIEKNGDQGNALFNLIQISHQSIFHLNTDDYKWIINNTIGINMKQGVLQENQPQILDIQRDFLKNYFLIQKLDGINSILLFLNKKIFIVQSDIKISCIGTIEDSKWKEGKEFFQYQYRSVLSQDNNHMFVQVLDIQTKKEEIGTYEQRIQIINGMLKILDQGYFEYQQPQSNQELQQLHKDYNKYMTQLKQTQNVLIINPFLLYPTGKIQVNTTNQQLLDLCQRLQGNVDNFCKQDGLLFICGNNGKNDFIYWYDSFFVTFLVQYTYKDIYQIKKDQQQVAILNLYIQDQNGTLVQLQNLKETQVNLNTFYNRKQSYIYPVDSEGNQILNGSCVQFKFFFENSKLRIQPDKIRLDCMKQMRKNGVSGNCSQFQQAKIVMDILQNMNNMANVFVEKQAIGKQPNERKETKEINGESNNDKQNNHENEVKEKKSINNQFNYNKQTIKLIQITQIIQWFQQNNKEINTIDMFTEQDIMKIGVHSKNILSITENSENYVKTFNEFKQKYPDMISQMKSINLTDFETQQMEYLHQPYSFVNVQTGIHKYFKSQQHLDNFARFISANTYNSMQKDKNTFVYIQYINGETLYKQLQKTREIKGQGYSISRQFQVNTKKDKEMVQQILEMQRDNFDLQINLKIQEDNSQDFQYLVFPSKLISSFQKYGFQVYYQGNCFDQMKKIVKNEQIIQNLQSTSKYITKSRTTVLDRYIQQNQNGILSMYQYCILYR